MNYPPIFFEHLETLTDSTGVIQHAIYSIPNRKTGYTTDDNARALIAAVLEYERTGSRNTLRLVSRYLSFLHYAQTPDGHFHNFMSFDQVWLDSHCSDDCFGRVLWACGSTLTANVHPNIKNVAKNLFDAAMGWIPVIQSIRGMAYMAMGCFFYLQAHPDNQQVRAELKNCADGLCDAYDHFAKPEWRWFEDVLTYSNGILVRALLFAYQGLGDERYLTTGLSALDFLTSICVIDGMLYPIGCKGWYRRGKERAFYDQQPVDPMAHIMSYLTAYETTKDAKYLKLAKISFDWFFGHNSVGTAMHDPSTGGCFDGLSEDVANPNQGAESTVCCLLSQLSMAPYIEAVASLDDSTRAME